MTPKKIMALQKLMKKVWFFYIFHSEIELGNAFPTERRHKG